MEDEVIIDVDSLVKHRVVFVNEVALLSDKGINLDDWFWGMLLCFLQDTVYDNFEALRLIYPIYVYDDNSIKFVNLGDTQEELDNDFYTGLSDIMNHNNNIMDLVMDEVSSEEYKLLSDLAEKFNNYSKGIIISKIKQ